MSKQRTDFFKAYGEFPLFNDLATDDPTYPGMYAAALNWCAAAFSAEELKAVVINYLEEGDEPIAHLELVPAYKFVAVGKIAYVRKQGNPIDSRTEIFYNNTIRDLRTIATRLATEKEKQVAVKAPPVSPLILTYRVGEMLEDLIDAERLLNSSQAYELLAKHKSRQGLLKAVQERFKAAQSEYLRANTEFKEYFEGVSKAAIDYRLRCYARILEDIESVMQNKKATRRKVQRRVSSERKVKNVTFCQNDDDLKIQSMDPTEIIGAQMVLIYNRKRKRITVFYAASEDGLSVKGTTIKGFDATKSVSKTLRRPDDQLSEFRRATRIRRVDVLINQIRGKEFEAKGRMNADTLILKAISG